jgi:hypothetical protein
VRYDLNTKEEPPEGIEPVEPFEGVRVAVREGDEMEDVLDAIQAMAAPVMGGAFFRASMKDVLTGDFQRGDLPVIEAHSFIPTPETGTEE